MLGLTLSLTVSLKLGHNLNYHFNAQIRRVGRVFRYKYRTRMLSAYSLTCASMHIYQRSSALPLHTYIL